VPVPLQVTDVRIRSLDLDFHEMSWKLVNTTVDVLDYTFQVLRSESPSGPFTALTPPFEDRYIFIDNIIQVADRWRQYFYVIRTTHKATGDFLDTTAAAKEPDPDLIALELRRHMQLLFNEFAGRRCWVLPVRTFGQRCDCWSASLQKKTRSGCRLCFDTSFVRGYLSPVESWLQVDPSPKTTQPIPVGKLQQSNTTMRMADYPPLKPNDLIIEPENRRWRVTKVSQTEHLRARVHQEVELHEIPPKDIEFSIPLILDDALRDLWLSPQRNYTNPSSLESFDREQAPQVFSLYDIKVGP
jgi:hypothetical protein